MCQIAYPLGYTLEAVENIEKSLNATELNNTGSRGTSAEALIFVQRLKAQGWSISN